MEQKRQEREMKAGERIEQGENERKGVTSLMSILGDTRSRSPLRMMGVRVGSSPASPICFFVQLAIALSTRRDCSTSSQSTGHAKSSSVRDGIDSMRDTVPEEEEEEEDDDEEEDKDDEGEDNDDEEEKEEDDKEDEEKEGEGEENEEHGRWLSFLALILSAVAS